MFTRSALAVPAALLTLVLAVGGCTRDNPYDSPAPTVPSPSAVTPTGDPLVAETTSGRLEGKADGLVNRFLGVRYAEPPTGERRWTLPELAEQAVEPVSARKSGPRCAQTATEENPLSRSEDCLFLDVTAPATARGGQNLPVMVWWHGGDYTHGSGSDYDAARLAAEGNVIVVTVNYRLGVFGYLSLPGLEGSGTFGLADQVMATRWARRNATAFGGDPDNVTVFGESAGAMSACAFLTSPEFEGLASKVAMSSGGSCRLRWPENGLTLSAPARSPYVSLAEGAALGVDQAREAGCRGLEVLDCLRATPVEDLLEISPQFHDVLAYGTPLLPVDPAQAVLEGRVSPVPVISSVNRHEARAFVTADEKSFTRKSYPAYVAAAYPGHETEVLAQYPLSDYDSPALAWSALITDSSWVCPTLEGDTALAANGSPVYAAQFAEPAAALGSDLPYLFDLRGQDPLEGEQLDLAATMVAYWTSFAHNGMPKAQNQPPWPEYSGPGGQSLRLRADLIETADLGVEHRCDFWADL
ncbi:carboxylesterase family protein [Kineosporia rhizophila]|uniref:carboxylesterase/lipase family protein n=1 Tax=Kineosporia rhizophila TaxID=84633 RepID=UPI001E2CB72A|nr:carboxylesterase family protein [Kineosporia rhizophila]MCE0537516.1 carboxylesterase family protein [Kineosporia rhizophila]